MPRNSSGIYTLPESAFVPNTIISSAAVNSDLNDIATALTQSLATTGVTPMSGQFLSASGNASAPGMSFASAKTTGFYLAGADQIGWAAAGAVAATFNSDKTVTWQGNQNYNGGITIGGTSTFSGSSTFSGALTFNSTSYTFGTGAADGLWNGLQSNSAIEFIIDGASNPILSGIKGWVEIPFNMTIEHVTLLANTTGSVQVDILSSSYSTYNPASSFTSICGSSIPTISSSIKYQDSTLSGWSTSLAAGSILEYNVVSNATTISLLTVSLIVRRTSN